MIPALLRHKAIPAVLLVLVLFFLFINERIFEWIYPIKFEELIDEAAEQYSVDKYFLAALIRTESNYKTDKVSSKGAAGLMQIMPETADWLAGTAGIRAPLGDRLFEPEINIQIGAMYVSYIRSQFANELGKYDTASDLAIVAAAYNAGPGILRRWLTDGTWSGKYADSGQIPYGETRHFVERVVYYYNRYQQIYGD